MKNTSKFQIIFIGALVAGLVIALLIFSGVIPLGAKQAAQTNGTGTVVLWGTLPFSKMNTPIRTLKTTAKTFNIVYIEKNPATIEQELIENLASGTGPDMVILGQDQLLRFRDKILPIPYASYSQASFSATFTDESNLLFSANGILGLPIVIDPLVMYYNQNMFETAGIALPPKTWTDVVKNMIPVLRKQPSGDTTNFTQNPIALGNFSNINNAKDILSALFLQVGVVPVYQSGGQLVNFFSTSTNNFNGAASKALQFYSDFSDPTKSVYSWNQSEDDSRDAFTSEKLAIYFGFASELSMISRSNPNLRFTVAKFPQSDSSKISATAGTMYSVAVLKSSTNSATGFIAEGLMSGPVFATDVSKSLLLPSARRDLLSQTPVSPYDKVFAESALISRGWLDPNKAATKVAFQAMIDSVVHGQAKSQDAVLTFGKTLDSLLKSVPMVK